MEKLLPILCMLLIATTGFGQEIESIKQFFDEADVFFAKNVEKGRVDYSGIKESPQELNKLVDFMKEYEADKTFEEVRKAFWINAYNLTTIKSIVEKYPISSPLDDQGFFTKEQHRVGGEMIPLSGIEKKKLLEPFKDERFHFVLVCAANGCPPLASFSYRPESIEQQIEQQTRVSLNDRNFIRFDDASGVVYVSQIFTWYKSDFDATGKSTIEYINQYREKKLPGVQVSTYEYDWKLNEDEKKKVDRENLVVEVIPTDNPPPTLEPDPLPTQEELEEELEKVAILEPEPEKEVVLEVTEQNEDTVTTKEDSLIEGDYDSLFFVPDISIISETRSLQGMTPSRLYRKGEFEFKWFNNLYTQKAFFNDDGDRTDAEKATYFTSFFQLMVGLHPRVNLGVDVIFKSVRTNPDRDATALEVFGFKIGTQNQTAISSFGPKIKFIPFKQLKNLSIQTALHVPGAIDMEGRNNEKPFLEYDKLRLWNQIFYDKYFSRWASLFVEADLIIYFAGQSVNNKGAFTQIPLTVFYSIFPTKKFTAFASGQYWPTLGDQSAYFIQMGLGVKYQITSWFDIEASYTNFVAGRTAGAGQTFNVGFRFVKFNH